MRDLSRLPTEERKERQRDSVGQAAQEIALHLKPHRYAICIHVKMVSYECTPSKATRVHLLSPVVLLRVIRIIQVLCFFNNPQKLYMCLTRPF